MGGSWKIMGKTEAVLNLASINLTPGPFPEEGEGLSA